MTLSIVNTFKYSPWGLKLFYTETYSWDNVLSLSLQGEKKAISQLWSHIQNRNQMNKQKQTGEDQTILYSGSQTRVRHTLDGFSWLMMVVFPLLSRPKHSTFTSFFFRPSHPASLSKSPICLFGWDASGKRSHQRPFSIRWRRGIVGYQRRSELTWATSSHTACNLHQRL